MSEAGVVYKTSRIARVRWNQSNIYDVFSVKMELRIIFEWLFEKCHK